MRILSWLNKTPKGVCGVALVIFGACVNFIPAIGSLASPYLMGAGAVLITGSVIDKSIKAYKGEDAFGKEKSIIAKFTTNKGDSNG